MNRTSNTFAGALLLLVGCQTMATDDDVPALISNPSSTSRAALQQVVNDVLGTEVTLADDALTSSSMLIIERKPPGTTQGRLATGRNMEPAIQFRLVMNNSDCILIDTRDETRYPLENTTCLAE